MTDPRELLIRDPDDFDPYTFPAPILEGQTPESWCALPPGERLRRVFVAYDQVREGHRKWFLERNPDGAEFEVGADWMRLNGAAAILAKAMRDAAEREADTPFVAPPAT